MLVRDEGERARAVLRRVMLGFAFLVPVLAAYHFWKVSDMLAGQVELLQEQSRIQAARVDAQKQIAWLMAEGTRLCAAELVEAPKWLGLVGRKPVLLVAAERAGKRGGVGGPE